MRNTEELTKNFVSSFLGRDGYEVTSTFNKLNWRKVDLGNWEQSKTVWKEITGYLILKDFLKDFQWNEDTVMQKQGVDFIYKGKNHDLKALVGNYHTEEGLNVTIELKQYGKSSFENKITDVLVYTILEETGVSVVFIDFKKLKDWIISKYTNYQLRTSNNGTGEYIKVPVRDLKDFSVVRSITI